MNLLFMTEIAPFPPIGGEKLRSYGILKLLSGLDLRVFAIIGKCTDNPIQRNGFGSIEFHTFDFERIKWNNRITNYINLFTIDNELISIIDELLSRNKIDVAYIDYHLYGQYISHFKKKNIPVIYGTHNAQARLIYQRPAVSFKNRITKFIDYLINRLHEFWFFRKADAIIVVSEEDKQYHKNLLISKTFFNIPNFLVDSDYTNIRVTKEDYIIMSANFRAFQNFFGLEWFVREVWNEQLWKKSRLLLVGLGSDEALENLASRYSFKNISAAGEVDDLKPYIAKARASVVPLLHGSGTRLKCIESMALKTQLVSTSKGAEGLIHNNSILIADDADNFQKSLIEVLDRKTDLTSVAFRAFIDNYSLAPNAIIFKNILQMVLK